MAAGDFQVFDQFAIHIGEKAINLETDDIKLALITSTLAPNRTATAVWGTYSANEVSGTGYTAGGASLSGPELILASNVATFDDDDSDITWSQNGAGFTDARYGILYSDTATTDEAIGFLDLGADVGNVAGDLVVSFNASGILTITVT